MAEFQLTSLKTEISVSKICTVHYFEYSKDHSFPGESHNFWEFVYVDKGEITAVAENTPHILRHGDIIFHKPNEWHTLYANGEIAPNIVIVTFSSPSKAMSFFENKIMKVGQREKNIITEIINEYLKSFSTPVDDTFTTYLTRKKEAVFGGEQMIKILLEQLLISMMRGSDIPRQTVGKTTRLDSNLNLMLGYMENNISGVVSVDDLSKYAGISRSAVAQVFRSELGCGPNQWFIKMKIDAAKRYIREGNLNFTQISSVLGYSGIHYFSRQFKKVTGMSPMEYARSIKLLLEKTGSREDLPKD